MAKVRLDQLVWEQGLAESLEQAQALIMAGRILVDDKRGDKAGDRVSENACLRLKGEVSPYVCRGALKLEGAHRTFGFAIHGRVVLDVGQSTGGFTDYVLQQGAQFVIGIDVGYGQLAMKLRQNPRVYALERTNIRLLKSESFRSALPEPVRLRADALSLVVMDVSFISILKTLPPIISLLTNPSDFVILIKPQFEAAKHEVGAGGIIRDPDLQLQIRDRVLATLVGLGFTIRAVCESPIRGARGNTEFFVWMRHERTAS